MIKAIRPRRAKASFNPPKKAKQPFGYGFYTTVHRLRHGRSAIRLSPKGYRYDPLRAWETAVGITPRRKSLAARARARKRTSRRLR